MRSRLNIAVVAFLAAAGLVTAGAAAAGSNDGDSAVSERTASALTKAALRATGGGTANSIERDSENNATFEVEVTKPDGTTVDVRLSADFQVVVIEGDAEDAGER